MRWLRCRQCEHVYVDGYFSPAALIEPGERTGKYRTGGDQLLVDERGKSHITAEDFAVAVLDELENPKNLKRRITVAY